MNRFPLFEQLRERIAASATSQRIWAYYEAAAPREQLAMQIGGGAVLLVLVWGLWRVAPRMARGLLALLALQLLSGVSNVVLGWPLLAALVHSAGAAGLTLLLSSLVCRAHAPSRQALPVRGALAPEVCA